MPRAKIDYDNPDFYNYTTIVNTKNPIPDLLCDFKDIYEFQLNRFDSKISDASRAEINKTIKNLKKSDVKPSHKNRVYICTNFDWVPFILIDIDPAVLNNMEIKAKRFPILDYDLSDDETETYYMFDNIPYFYVSTLFIFEQGEPMIHIDIRPNILAELIAVFKSENLFNYSNFRDSWYGIPRRKAKSFPLEG